MQKKSTLTVRSNSSKSIGLKSRLGSCPYAPVARGSGVVATRGREFPNSKRAGRNASEPMSNLVNILETPPLWSATNKRQINGQINGVRHHYLDTTKPVKILNL